MSVKMGWGIVLVLLLVWLMGAWGLQRAIDKRMAERVQMERLIQRFDTLSARWSSKKRKEARRRFEALLHIHHIQPTIRRNGQSEKFTFEVGAKEADRLLNGICKLPLTIRMFKLSKTKARRLRVEMEITR